jgi:diacylglycerol kinase family enzyme
LRISLLCSAVAGNGVSPERLRSLLERCGHHVVHLLEEKSELREVLGDSIELVVAAGGDGTVWRAASALIGQEVPLAILPLGTANNIARSLGIQGSPGEIIESWKSARSRPLDLGVARGGWGEDRFVEAIGSGLVSSGITAVETEPDQGGEDEDADAKVARAVRRYRGVLSRMKPRRWGLTVDGARMDGEYLLLEVLNIRSVGPNLALSPHADPTDGLFDVVTAGEEQREELDRYLEGWIPEGSGRLDLPTHRGRRVDITGWEEMHVDDTVIAGPSVGSVEIRMEPGALRFLG